MTYNGALVPEGTPSGIRDSNGLYNEMTVALEWNIDPDEWYTKSRAARAMMIATNLMKARVENAVIDGRQRK